APAPELDYASAGLAHVLARELGRTGVPVIGADRMSDLVGDPAAPAVRWRDTAASLGAAIVIEGRIAGAGDRLELVVDAVGPDGTVFAEVRRTAAADRLPAVVRELAPGLAATLLGRPV